MYIINCFSFMQEIVIKGVLQGSILGPIFVYIHICDVFYLIETWETVNYADEALQCTAVGTVADVINSLEICAKILFK